MTRIQSGTRHEFIQSAVAGLLCIVLSVISACSSQPHKAIDADTINAQDLLTVDCLLPSQVRQLGTGISYMAPRRAIRTAGAQCALRGGEYVAYDRADFASALAVWMPMARQGDPEAQTYVGEIYEKGLGTRASYELAAQWYQRAVEQGYSRAQTNLGYLYESGLGVERDLTRALNLYRQASGFTSAELEFVSAIEIAQRESTLAESARLSSQLELLKEQISIDQRQLLATLEQLKASQQQVDRLHIALHEQRELSAEQKSLDLQNQLNSSEAELESLKQEVSSLQKRITDKQASRAADAPGEGISQTQSRGASIDIIGPTATERGLKNSARTTPLSLKGVEFGSYHALIIGNDTYEHLNNLKTAGNDAIAVERVLREKYGFNTVLLLNANQKTLLMALERMRATLDKQDNLVIYYAGHGEVDRHSGAGYWLPTDSRTDNKNKWIANSAVTAIIDTIAAKHVLVIADSCYSGSMTQASVARALPQSDNELKLRWLKAVSRSRVRTVLSSGQNQPVLDGGSVNAEHSVFAGVFLQLLQENTSVLETYELFYQLQQRVADNAARLNVKQVPQYAPIRHSGHQAGEFLFVPSSRLHD